MFVFMHFLFFLQAEDGIRDIGVTGVQTCALPISRRCSPGWSAARRARTLASPTPPGRPSSPSSPAAGERAPAHRPRSEERRVGEECRSRGAPDHLKKKKCSE